jgi:phosphatidylinositol phosphate synthase
MVSYTRARAEALGVECKVGFAQRPPRVVLLTLGILLAAVEVAGVSILAISVYALALLTSVTALQRVLHVRGALRAEGV